MLILLIMQLNQTRLSVYEAQGRMIEYLFLSFNEPFACSLHSFSKKIRFQINCPITFRSFLSICMNAFEVRGRWNIFLSLSFYCQRRQAYHQKNDGRVEISDVYVERLFDHCRRHSFIHFNSTFLGPYIDFFVLLVKMGLSLNKHRYEYEIQSKHSRLIYVDRSMRHIHLQIQ